MSNVVKGTVKRVASTGGVILVEHEFKEDGRVRWFNPIPQKKQQVLAEMKPKQVIELDLHENDIFKDFSILEEQQEEQKQKFLRRAHPIQSSDFEKFCKDIDAFTKEHNQSAVVPFQKSRDDEPFMAIILYTEEAQ